MTAAGMIVGSGAAAEPQQPPSADFAAVYKVLSGQDQPPPDLQDRYRLAWQTDPSFRCAHPSVARHFANTQPAAIPPSTACPSSLPFLVRSREGARQVLWLDTTRVRGIHLLFSGQGEAWASRFGHVSLRLVICPHADATQAACDENLQEHLVLGYLATVDSVAIDPLKGMFGGYAAHLNAMPFMDVYREYTIDEFRDLYALPLRLNPDRLQQVVRELGEIHWQFTDDYRFFNNNCATMLQTALRWVMPELFEGAAPPGFSWRPDTFFENMRHPRVAVTEVLTDLVQAERDGYFFASTRAIFEQAARWVTETTAWTEAPGLESYLAATAQHRQATWQATPGLPARLNQDRKLRDALLMLEELSAVRANRRLLASAAHYLTAPGLKAALEAQRDDAPPSQRQLITPCLLEPLARLHSTPDRYDGIPDAPTPSASPAASGWMAAECREVLAGSALSTLLDQVHPEGAADWQKVLAEARQVAEVVRNVAWIRQFAR